MHIRSRHRLLAHLRRLLIPRREILHVRVTASPAHDTADFAATNERPFGHCRNCDV